MILILRVLRECKCLIKWCRSWELEFEKEGRWVDIEIALEVRELWLDDWAADSR